MKEKESKRVIEEGETKHTIVRRKKTIEEGEEKSVRTNNNYHNSIKTNKKQPQINNYFRETLKISNSSSERNDDATTVVVTPNIFFIEKAARSIAEIQQKITTVADVMIFLEILGYDDKLANEMGYHDLVGLAQDVFPYVHFYSRQEKDLLSNAYNTTTTSNSLSQVSQNWQRNNNEEDNGNEGSIPSLRMRIQEGLGIALPWIGSLFVLYALGISLWMSGLLPTVVTTFFLGGVFIGLIISEGILQISTRQFSFYYSQKNFGEIRRIITRNYIVTATISGILIVLTILIASYSLTFSSNNGSVNDIIIVFQIKNYTNIFEGNNLSYMVSIFIFGMISIIAHRSSFMIIYAMKKISYVSLSYGCGLAALIFAFYLLEPVIPNNVTARYIVSLTTALGTLTTFALVQHIKVLSRRTRNNNSASEKNDSDHHHHHNHQSITSNNGHYNLKNTLNFYSPSSDSRATLRSNFGIQLWDGAIFFAYGIAYFLILFEDRLISWIHFSNGSLIIAFNSSYHMGADLALIILFASGILEYIYLSPLHSRINKILTQIDISQITAVGRFLQSSYKRALMLSLLISGIFAMALQFIGPYIIENVTILHTRDSIARSLKEDNTIAQSNNNSSRTLQEQSIRIMRMMSISYIILAIASVNITFLLVLNKAKYAVFMLGIAVIVNATIGLNLLGIYNNNNINAVAGSLVANTILALISTSYMVKILKDKDLAAASFLSRFV